MCVLPCIFCGVFAWQKRLFAIRRLPNKQSQHLYKQSSALCISVKHGCMTERTKTKKSKPRDRKRERKRERDNGEMKRKGE